MIIHNMCGAPVNIASFGALCFEVMTKFGKRPERAIVHPAQEAMILSIAAQISDIYLEDIRDKIKSGELPVGAIEVKVRGIPLHIDASIPDSQIRFEDSEGKEVGRLEGLAIPTEFTR
jgi:hypothetical protein